MSHWFYEALYSTEINTATAVFRLVLSLLVGSVIGLERRWRQQPTGLRTHILICLGSTLLMMLSIYVPQAYNGGDPGRIAAQIVAGIGFLGAGAIIKTSSNIRGLTTASAIWLMAAIGMGIGAGLYVISSVAALLMLFTLLVFERFERNILPVYTTKVLTVITDNYAVSSERIIKILKTFPLTVKDVNVHHSFTQATTEMNFTITFKDNLSIDNIIESIGGLERVDSVNLL